MKFILRKSGWLAAMALSLLLGSLLSVMALNSPSRQLGEQPHQQQASYTLALPTIMAPVIRKEVRKEAPAELSYNNSGSPLPSLFSTFLLLP